MARHDLHLHAAAHCGGADIPTAIDALIKPGLRRAFPLPAADQGDGAAFRVLLDAFARRHGGGTHRASHFTVAGS